MTKKAKKKQLDDKSIKKAKRRLPEAMVAKMIKPGEVRNPNGRPKGSRARFSEKFLQDFIEHWEVHGTKALDDCLDADPAAYVGHAVKILPKDFNINMVNEAELDKLLDRFSLDQLRDLATGLAAIGASARQEDKASGAGKEPDSVH